ncbi:hypothetical protein FOA52_003710 [Chlamydomonas sp. UWO 241]|nr:hypothetical protein FOA52_003710 [Chlamydomonas sp. UWO 241]
MGLLRGLLQDRAGDATVVVTVGRLPGWHLGLVIALVVIILILIAINIIQLVACNVARARSSGANEQELIPSKWETVVVVDAVEATPSEPEEEEGEVNLAVRQWLSRPSERFLHLQGGGTHLPDAPAGPHCSPPTNRSANSLSEEGSSVRVANGVVGTRLPTVEALGVGLHCSPPTTRCANNLSEGGSSVRVASGVVGTRLHTVALGAGLHCSPPTTCSANSLSEGGSDMLPSVTVASGVVGTRLSTVGTYRYLSGTDSRCEILNLATSPRLSLEGSPLSHSVDAGRVSLDHQATTSKTRASCSGTIGDASCSTDEMMKLPLPPTYRPPTEA